MKEKIETFKKQYAEQKAAMKKVTDSLTDELLADVQKVLAEQDVIDRIQWAQYTPYFNDGDACNFGVGEPRFFLTESAEEKLGVPESDEREGISEWTLDYWNKDKKITNPEYLEEVKKALGTVEDACGFVEHEEFEDALKDRFGDHAEVTITKDKIDVEEYDHD